MKKYKITVIAFFIFGLALSSCETENVQDTIDSLQELAEVAQDQTLLDNEFSAIYNSINDEANADSLISGQKSKRRKTNGLLPSCANVSFDLSTNTMIVDYGSSNCLCNDGRFRRGKLVTVFSGKYRTSGTTATTTLEDYFVNNIQFTGTKVTTNLGNETGNFKYAYQVRNASAITPTGNVFWETDAIIERIQGDSTLTPLDDVYLSTGNSKGTNRQGISYEVNTLSPLKTVVDVECLRYFVSGRYSITTQNNNELLVDYDPVGNESCDNLISVSLNGGNPIEITLP